MIDRPLKFSEPSQKDDGDQDVIDKLAAHGVDAPSLLRACTNFQASVIVEKLKSCPSSTNSSYPGTLSAEMSRWDESFDFQDRILREGVFKLDDPETGANWTCTRSICLGLVIFYKFGNSKREHDFYLIVGVWTTGMAQQAIWWPETNIYLPFSQAARRRREKWINSFHAMLQEEAKFATPYLETLNCNATVATTDCNQFAHYIWNILSGIQRVVENKLHDGIRVYTCASPLGPLDRIFPELKGQVVEFRSRRALSREVMRKQELAVALGSVFISNGLISRLRELANRLKSETASRLKDEILRDGVPVLGISLRTNNRRWRSLNSGISSLINSLAAGGINFTVVFFGFSVPETEAVSGFSNQIQDELDAASEISSNCPGVKFRNLIGESIWDCFSISGTLKYYIAHMGTIQHKIGWFSECSGIIHGNRHSLESGQSSFQSLHARRDGPPSQFIDYSVVSDWIPDGPIAGAGDRENLHDYDFHWSALVEPVKLGLTVA